MGSVRAVIVSVVVHTVVVAVLALVHEDAPPPPPRVGGSAIAIVDVAPIEVDFLPGATGGDSAAPAEATDGDAPVTSHRAHGHGHGRGIAATEGTGAGSGEATPAPPGDGDGDSHEKLNLTISGDVLAAILNKPLPPPIPHNPTAEGGTKLTVDADGSAHVDPHGGAEAHVILPTTRKEAGAMVDAWAKDPDAYTKQEGTIANEVAKTSIVPIFGGSFGAPDDRNRQKRILDSTFEQRADQRATHTAEQLGHADQLVRANLARLWRRVTNPAERRRELFALWDECAEGDSAIGEAGERARRQVVAWIRSHLPAGSTGAYSADEIEALDGHRSSTQHFAPYE